MPFATHAHAGPRVIQIAASRLAQEALDVCGAIGESMSGEMRESM
ncbi:MAG: hypothetical protein SGJ11_07970 [Phycisphaerae bacterium]|nr:hypothetical protein [Phycisphaerae bacterium]